MVADAGLLAAEMLLVAFAGGAIGAAIGGYPAYGLAGLIVTVGELTPVAVGFDTESVVVGDPAVGSGGLTGLVGYGPVLGPHVAFAGGVAAAAYAGRKGYLAPGSVYHPAKNVSSPLGSRPDVLLVGGVFGVVGYWLAQLSVQLSLPWDPVAASVVLSAVLHRVVFGYPLVGRLGADLLDMSPYFAWRRRASDAGDDGAPGTESPGRTRSPTANATDSQTDATGSQTDATGSRTDETTRRDGGGPDADTVGRRTASGPVGGVEADSGHPSVGNSNGPTVEPWLPHQSAWANVTTLGFVVGLFGGFLAVATGSYALAFGLTATTLLLVVADVERFPVTHHMALPASIAALGLPEADVVVAVLVGGAFGAAAGITGELSQRVFYAHADTHFDPPSAAILVTTLAIAALDVAGVFQGTVIPTGALA